MTPRPGAIVAVIALAALAYITLNSLRTSGPGSTGPPAGERVVWFAAPLVTSDLVGDANVATGPDQGSAGALPACAVRDPRALNVCVLVRERPLVLAFLGEGQERCSAQLDTIERVSPRFPDVAFAAVAIRGDRDELRELVRERGWSFPVAQDRDGIVANLYGVAICPTVVLAYRGGVVMDSALGDELASPAALARAVRALRAGPPEREGA